MGAARHAGRVDGAPPRPRADGGYWLGVRLPGDEEPERGDVLAEQLAAAGVELVEPGEHGLDPILAVHDADFVDFLSRAWPAWVAEGHLEDPGQPEVVPYLFATAGYAARHRKDRRPATIRAEAGLYAMDTMSLISEGTFAAACAAADGAVTAADLVAAGLPPAAYAAVRPPGHHAGPGFFGGSCYLNNAAVAAQRLPTPAATGRAARHRQGGDRRHRRPSGQRHAGDLLVSRRRVLRQRARRPGGRLVPAPRGPRRRDGEGPGAGCNRNAVVAPGAGDDPWLAALDELLDAVRAFGPDVLVVSLGVDAAIDDPESPLQITAAGYGAAGERLGALRLPTVLVQEGGYHLPTLGAARALSVLTGVERGAGSPRHG